MEPTKTAILYDGSIIIDFFEGRHWYVKRGTKGTITSVTGATGKLDKSRVLMGWATGLTRDNLTTDRIEELKKAKTTEEIVPIVDEACNLYNVKREEAATIGSEVHDWAERYIKGKKKDRAAMTSEKELKGLSEPVLNGVTAFLRWIKAYKVEFLESEKMVYSKKHDYVGLMDLKAKVNGKLAVVDFKTSSGVYNDYRYQVAAYRAADEEETGEKYEETWIIKFGKEDGEFGAYKITNHKEDFKTFLGLLTVAKREKELKRKDNWLRPEGV